MSVTNPQTKSIVTVEELNRLIPAGNFELLDVRTPGEFAVGHVPGAKLVPVDQMDAPAIARERALDGKTMYVLCHSGVRAKKAIEKLQRAGYQGAVLVEGGTEAWIRAGLPVIRGESKVIPLMRQVQIIVGSICALGAVLALTVNPLFAILPLIMGSGLVFAGITGFCGLAVLLTKMPWNRVASGQNCCK